MKHEDLTDWAHDHVFGAGSEAAERGTQQVMWITAADAATSVLAIVALLGGWRYGWAWPDPLMGVVGALLVAFWAKGQIVGTELTDLQTSAKKPRRPIGQRGFRTSPGGPGTA